MVLKCRLLGVPSAVVAGVEPGGQTVPGRLMPLLAYLILNAGRAVPRSELASALWPDSGSEESRANLRRHLHLLAQALRGGDAFFTLDTNAVRWNSDAPVQSDLEEDDAGVELLAGLDGEWVRKARESHEKQVRCRLAARLQRALEESRYADAIDAAEALLERDPFDEESVRALMQSRSLIGDRAGALAAFSRLEERLSHEFGAEPDPRTQQAFETILAGEAQHAVPNNLPRARTRFVGREAEVARVRDLLKSERLVTLAGTGGIGKTRIALRCAESAQHRFPDGVWFVECSAIREGAHLGARFAQILHGGQTADARAYVLNRLSAANALIVFDACEHLLQDVASLARDILASAPGTRILTTSRRALRVDNECVVAIEPFALPAEHLRPERLREHAAAKLFLDRAAIVAPDFTLTHSNAAAVGEIVRRTSGVPLAIELAVARLNVLTVEGIAKRLAEHFEQFAGSKLRDVVQWSFDLLSKREQTIFTRLGVFPQDFALEAVQAICGPDDIFEPFSELVEASLVQARQTADGMRYVMLDTTRLFAQTMFAGAPDAHVVRERHAAYFAGFVAQRRQLFRGAENERAHLECATEIANIRAAIEWALGEQFELGATLTADLGGFWWRMPFIGEGEVFTARITSDARFEHLDPALRGRIQRLAGIIARVLSDSQRSLALMTEALASFEAAGDSAAQAGTLMGLGVAVFYLGRYDEAREYLLRALPMAREYCEPSELATILGNLGSAELSVGNLDAAQRYLNESSEIFAALDLQRLLSQQLTNLSLVQYLRGDAGAAVAAGLRALQISQHIGAEPYRIADCLNKVSMGLRLAGRLGDAWEANRRALELVSDGKHRAAIVETLEDAARTALALGQVRSAAFGFHRAGALREEIGMPPNPIERDELAVARDGARAALGDAAWAALRHEALAVPLEGIIETVRDGAGRF